MPNSVAEPGLLKAVVAVLSKPFGIIATPIAERIAARLERKPRLNVRFRPLTCLWCIAQSDELQIMQIVFSADFTNDDIGKSLVIIDAYVKGTRSWHPFEKFSIGPHTLFEHHGTTFVSPVIAEKGQDWTGRLIFVDQFGRKHRSPKMTFTWIGGISNPQGNAAEG